MKKKKKVIGSTCGPQPRTVQECREIVAAEWKYWQEHDNTESSVGALGAVANIYVALQGWRAPWHPKHPKHPKVKKGKK